MMLNRLEYSKPSIWVIAGQEYNFDWSVVFRGSIQCKQALNERERNARLQNDVLVVALVLSILLEAAFTENPVRFGKVEQRARRNRYNELVIDRIGHL